MLAEMLKGVVLPAGVVTVVLVLAARPWRSRAAAPPPAFTSLALWLGFAAGFAALYGLPTLPPREYWQSLFYLAIPVAALSMLRDGSGLPSVGRAAALLIVAALFAWCVVPDFADIEGSRNTWCAVAAGCFVVVRLAVVWSCGRLDARLVASILMLSAIAAAGFLILAHTARFAQVCGILAALAGAGLALSLWRAPALAPASAAGVLAVLLLAVVLVAMFYDESAVPRVAFICVGMAPAAGAIAGMLTHERVRGVWAGVLHIAFVLAPMIVAFLLAWTGGASTGGEGYDYGAY